MSNSCDPVDYNPPGSSVRGVLQARTLERLPLLSPGNLPNPGIEPTSPVSLPVLAGGFFPTEPPGKPWAGLNCLLCPDLSLKGGYPPTFLSHCPFLLSPRNPLSRTFISCCLFSPKIFTSTLTICPELRGLQGCFTMYLV